MLQRHSSRRTRLDRAVLNQRLAGALSYDRIAGYFRSSLFEVAGEALAAVNGPVRIICNSDCDPQDLATAAAAQAALRRSWCAGKPEDAPPSAIPRYRALYEALTRGKLTVRVLPDQAFGLIHGKAGLIRRADGTATAFLGSVNESKSAWQLNYELLWEDDSPDSVRWVEEEFLALWNDPRAVDLSVCPFIVQDVERIIARRVVEPADWKETVDVEQAAAAAAVETPVYRRDQGLWPHQKYFARLALERHRLGGARLVLADQVGLGKTVQLAMAALLMALDDPAGGPILVLAPKPLLPQWQGELMELLELPSARWNGKAWVDENGLEYPGDEASRALGKCPRRIGLVSQGLIVRGKREVIDVLLSRHYTCVIVDEAHRARRRALPKVDASDDEVDAPAEPNKLMAFLRQIGPRTKSMLLATATPVQLHPVEAWDLLHALSQGNDGVLGGATRTSKWSQPSRCLAVATGKSTVPLAGPDGWEYVRDPLPAKTEGEPFDKIRSRLNAADTKWQFTSETFETLPTAIRRVTVENGLLPGYGTTFNPLLRCIVRRTRAYLENTINPATGGYFLPRVRVRLFGEDADSAIVLSGYLHEAYQEAEHFCELLKRRVRSAGFFRTLLLRRIGSSMESGLKTVLKLLREDEAAMLDPDDEDDSEGSEDAELWPVHTDEPQSAFRDFSMEEIESLQRVRDLLRLGGNRDPKLESVLGFLLGQRRDTEGRWADLGCILFSQYYDTVRWFGAELAKHEAFAAQDIGLYAGSNRSGFWRAGVFQRCDRETLKKRVRAGELKILLGTDAASEGLNLQRLGTLINIDLPWNPTRLEQRKGRIQRIGQNREEVWIANLRYLGSVEDRVHNLLSSRLEAIHTLFGQIPDTLEDVWVQIAEHNEAKARELIDRTTATQNPFDVKYSKVEDAQWESCTHVLNAFSAGELLRKGWA
jgi:hypothetical protein